MHNKKQNSARSERNGGTDGEARVTAICREDCFAVNVFDYWALPRAAKRPAKLSSMLLMASRALRGLGVS